MNDLLDRPLWFRLIDRWVPEGMGTTGVTLPFIVGAFDYVDSPRTSALNCPRALLDTMVRFPVPGFTVEVRQCHNIESLVLSVARTKDALPFNGCVLLGPSQVTALGFSQDAQSAFGGLDSSDAAICSRRLAENAEPHCSSGNFSRIRNQQTGEFTFGPLTPGEIEYIERQVNRCARNI